MNTSPLCGFSAASSSKAAGIHWRSRESLLRRTEIAEELYVGVIGSVWMAAGVATFYFPAKAIFADGSWWYSFGDFDPDTSGDFDALEAITIYRQGEPCSMMTAYTAQIAMCICHLNEALILFARP
jgi:hypothetical protein